MNKLIPFGNLAAQISRRDFLRLCGLGFLGLSLPEKMVENFISKISDDRQEEQLGRVAKPGQKLFEEPDLNSKVIKELPVDSILKIKDVIIGRGETSLNQVWFEVEDQGFVHSMYVQPVADKKNQPGAIILGDGCLGEITVPFVDSYRQMNVKNTFVYRLYYASTYWVLSRDEDDGGTVWYQLLDDRNYSTFYAPAVAVRLVPKSELLPISPDVPWEEKSIDVDLSTQNMIAYEGNRVVFSSRISSGVRTREGGFSTPKGYFRTTRKRPCRHMAYPGDENYTGYDLPGVPWVSYFTSNGVAFHGTYWHNDFGVPHSHGCVNMTPEAAKWVYLWTTPAVLPGKYFYGNDYGTRVVIY
jgi:hypothetical protein